MTFEVVGIYTANPLVALFVLGAIIVFLEFPVSFFYWGEIWLWVLMLEILPLTGCILMFLCLVVYIILFFRLWWGIIFGGLSYLVVLSRVAVTWDEALVGMYLIGFQYLIGVQPNMLI